jgi:hypothetical protein
MQRPRTFNICSQSRGSLFRTVIWSEWNARSLSAKKVRMSRVVIVCIIAIFLAIWVCPVAAGQVTIKVVNGHNGKPLKGTTVGVWFGRKASPPPTQVTTTNDGNTFLPIPDSIETMVIAGQRVGDCRAGNRKSYIEGNVYRVQDILRTGVVAQNTCSNARNQPTPGVLVFYVRPLHWWDKMHD